MPDWFWNNLYNYWSMSPYFESTNKVWEVNTFGYVTSCCSLSNNRLALRPVINVYKDKLPQS